MADRAELVEQRAELAGRPLRAVHPQRAVLQLDHRRADRRADVGEREQLLERPAVTAEVVAVGGSVEERRRQRREVQPAGLGTRRRAGSVIPREGRRRRGWLRTSHGCAQAEQQLPARRRRPSRARVRRTPGEVQRRAQQGQERHDARAARGAHFPRTLRSGGKHGTSAFHEKPLSFHTTRSRLRSSSSLRLRSSSCFSFHSSATLAASSYIAAGRVRQDRPLMPSSFP